MKKETIIELNDYELRSINGGGALGLLIGMLIGATTTIGREGGTLCTDMPFK